MVQFRLACAGRGVGATWLVFMGVAWCSSVSAAPVPAGDGGAAWRRRVHTMPLHRRAPRRDVRPG